MLVEFKQKSQVTIPSHLVKQLDIKTGDQLDIEVKDGRLVITPVIMVPKDQTWFYTPQWQAAEREVDCQIKKGQLHTADSKEQLFKDLGLDQE